jgi:hypothetical protein
MLRRLGEPIDISLEALVHQDLPLKGVFRKPSGRVILHSYAPCAFIHVHDHGFASEGPPDLVPAPKTPALSTSLALSHRKAPYHSAQWIFPSSTIHLTLL